MWLREGDTNEEIMIPIHLPLETIQTLFQESVKDFQKISGTPSYSKYLLSEFSRSPEDKKVDDKIHELLFRSENEEEIIGTILDLQKRGIDTSTLSIIRRQRRVLGSCYL